MERLGTLTFQASGSADVFHIADVREEGVDISDEALIVVEDVQFESDKAWISGKVPPIKPVDIGGDTTLVRAWFKADRFDRSFMIRVYVEYELAEEFIGVEPDHRREDNDRDIEQREFIL